MKNVKNNLVIKSKKGPINKPIIFSSITEAMDYIKKYP